MGGGVSSLRLDGSRRRFLIRRTSTRFLRSKLSWEEVHEGRHAEMLDWYRRLIELRRGSVALNDGAVGHVRASFDERRRWLVFERGVVTVMCNLGTEKVERPHLRRMQLLLASKAGVVVKDGSVELPADSVAILSSEAMR